MTTQIVAIGPFAAVYIADAPSGNFINVTTVTTGDQQVAEVTEEVFLYSLGNTIQAGPRTINCDLIFLGDAPYVNYLARGNSLSTTLVQDASSSFNSYSVILLGPGGNTNASNIYIPNCHTVKKYNLPMSKSKASQIGITFSHQEIDRSIQLYYKRDVATLKSILGGRSPF